MAAFSELLSRAKRAASNGKSLLNIGRQQYVQALEDTAAYYARKAGVPDGYTSTIPTPTPIPTPAVRSERKVPDASKDALAAREAAQRLSYSLPAEAQASVGRQNSPMTGTELREVAANQEQIKKDLNTLDLYVNRGLTGTERRENYNDMVRAAQRAAAEEERQRNKGLTGTERLAPLRELEQQRKNLEAEKTDMYDHPENYIWTEPLTGTERREKGYDYTNRFDYGTELAKRGAEYDSQIEKIDQQIAELRAINYEKLAYEPDFNKYVKIGAEMESELRDNPDDIYTGYNTMSLCKQRSTIDMGKELPEPFKIAIGKQAR